MTIRTNAAQASRGQQSSFHRCTNREFDDDHDIMQVKQADVLHSETPTDVQVHWPTGMTAHPMSQGKDQQQQSQQSSGGGGGSDPDMMGGYNNNQPKGESSIGHVSYYGGSRANPVMSSVDEPRHRPYQTKEGESLFYAADGHGSALYHRRRQDGKDGVYILTCDGNDQQDGGAGTGPGTMAAQQQSKRFVSIRHANKKRQKRKKGQSQGGGSGGGGGQLAASGGNGGGQQQEEYKHEGDSVNVESRYTAQQIQHYDGDTIVGYYDKSNKDWIYHTGSKEQSMRADQSHSHIKNDGAHVWVQKGICYKSIPFVVKADPCK